MVEAEGRVVAERGGGGGGEQQRRRKELSMLGLKAYLVYAPTLYVARCLVQGG